MRGGEKFYQSIDNTRKKNQCRTKELIKTIKNIHNQCPENQRC